MDTDTANVVISTGAQHAGKHVEYRLGRAPVSDTGTRPSLHSVLSCGRCQAGDDLMSPTNHWGTLVKWNFAEYRTLRPP